MKKLVYIYLIAITFQTLHSMNNANQPSQENTRNREENRQQERNNQPQQSTIQQQIQFLLGQLETNELDTDIQMQSYSPNRNRQHRTRRRRQNRSERERNELLQEIEHLVIQINVMDQAIAHQTQQLQRISQENYRN